MKLKRILAGIIACTMVATAMGVTAFAADTEPTDVVTTTETEILAGDIDNDGDVDMQDALTLARYLVSGDEDTKAAFAELMELNLDAVRDENGDINITSAINVLKEVVKTIPVETTPEETTVDTDETTVDTDETTVDTDETTVDTDETTVDTDETTVETSLEELVAEYDAAVDSYEDLVDSDSYALISNQPAIMVAVGNAMIAIDEVDVEDADSVKATMATVNTAIAKITAAITEIEAAQIPAVLAEIQVIVDDAGELVEDDYTADSFAALIEALVANDALTEDSSLAEIIAVKQSLVSAMAGLVTVLEEAQANLDAVIADVEALVEEDYTADSWEAVSTALTEAKALEEATVEEINAAKVALEDAMAALVLQADVDQAAYDAAVAELNTYIKTNGANYDAYKDIQGEVVDEVNAAILAMYEVANAEDITEVTPIIVAAVEAIKEASATFVLDAAATELLELIGEADALGAEDYTKITFDALGEAIADARTLFTDGELNEDVTLAEVTAAKTAIAEAVEALVSADLEDYDKALATYDLIKADADFNAVKDKDTTIKNAIILAEAAIDESTINYKDATIKLNKATAAIIVEIANKVGSNKDETGEYEVALAEYKKYLEGAYYIEKSITQDNVGLVAEVALYHGIGVYAPVEIVSDINALAAADVFNAEDFAAALKENQTYITRCRTATPKISAATATLKASYEAALAEAKTNLDAAITAAEDIDLELYVDGEDGEKATFTAALTDAKALFVDGKLIAEKTVLNVTDATTALTEATTAVKALDEVDGE